MIHVMRHQAEIMKYIFELDKSNSNCDHVSALLQIKKKFKLLEMEVVYVVEGIFQCLAQY